ncbi:MAG: ABC transporter [Pseudonocardiaceae bacterium]|nr:ABC transporter [Pseudonocardiaceae bacterium]
MTATTTSGTTVPAGDTGTAVRSRGAAGAAAFRGLILRDIAVLRRQIHIFLARTVVQPLLLVFVFAHVFPQIAQGVGGATGASRFTNVLVPGVVALAIVINGVQAVAVNLVGEIGHEREINDRVLAPLPVSVVALEKILYGAMEGLLAGLVVFPIAAVIPATPFALDPTWPVLLTVIPLACLASAALGLALGTAMQPRSLTFLFNIVLLPLTMLGGLFYSWSDLETIPWLQVAVLLNPLTYMSEGLRAALVTDVGHLPLMAVYVPLAVFAVGFTMIGVRGFRRRVLG